MPNRGLLLSLLTAIALHWLLLWGFAGRSGTGVSPSRDLRPPRPSVAARIVQLESASAPLEQRLDQLGSMPTPAPSDSGVALSVAREKYRALERRLDSANELNEQTRQRAEQAAKTPDTASIVIPQVSNELDDAVNVVISCVDEQGRRFSVTVPPNSVGDNASSSSQVPNDSNKQDPCVQG